MTAITGAPGMRGDPQDAVLETSTPGQALAGARASAGAREESTRPTRRQEKAARSEARHEGAATAAQTGAEAFKAGLDHVLARLKNLERTDPARAERYRLQLGAQLHDIARTIPGATGGPK